MFARGRLAVRLQQAIVDSERSVCAEKDHRAEQAGRNRRNVCCLCHSVSLAPRLGHADRRRKYAHSSFAKVS
jgi:hypothetical protein